MNLIDAVPTSKFATESRSATTRNRHLQSRVLLHGRASVSVTVLPIVMTYRCTCRATHVPRHHHRARRTAAHQPVALAPVRRRFQLKVRSGPASRAQACSRDDGVLRREASAPPLFFASRNSKEHGVLACYRAPAAKTEVDVHRTGTARCLPALRGGRRSRRPPASTAARGAYRCIGGLLDGIGCYADAITERSSRIQKARPSVAAIRSPCVHLRGRSPVPPGS